MRMEPHEVKEDELAVYLEQPYAIRIQNDTCDERPCFMAVHPELEGCMAQGDTPQEAVANLKDALRDYISALLEMGITPPLPRVVTEQSSITMAGVRFTFTFGHQPAVAAVYVKPSVVLDP